MTLLYVIYGVLAAHRYIAIPINAIDDINMIEVNPIASSLSLPRVLRQTETYVPPATSAIIHQDNSERLERPTTRILDYVDFGGHTGSNGAFSWYADYPAYPS